jgi:tetratricopeptide (TPR) repeat protein
MSEITSPSADELPSEEFPPRPRGFSPRFIISIVFVFGLALWGFSFVPREMARWHHAAARNALTDGKMEEVIALADKGLRWNDEYTELLELRAAVNLESGKLEESLRDYDRIIELASRDNKITETDIRALSARTIALQRLDRYQESVDTWTQVVDYRRDQFESRADTDSQRLYALALNNRAYTQAQGRIDIKGALSDINEAIEILGREDDPVFIDTLGYLLLINGQTKEAKFYLEQAAALAKTQDDEKRAQIRQLMKRVVDQRGLEAELKRLDENYAVIVHHRGEAYEATGEQEKAEADYAEAKKLGYDREKGIW